MLSPKQLDEAIKIQRQTGAKEIQEIIAKHASAEEATRAVADHFKVPYIDLTDVTIPPSVIALVPESVARENVILPISQEGGALKIAMSDPTDFDTMQKLQFIMNRDIHPVLSPREQIIEAIDRHYGRTEISMRWECELIVSLTHADGSAVEESELDAIRQRLLNIACPREVAGSSVSLGLPGPRQRVFWMGSAIFERNVAFLRVIADDKDQPREFFVQLKKELQEQWKLAAVAVVMRRVAVI
jgi:hypothetical protein